MCAIGGVLDFTEGNFQEQILSAAKAMSHRGPDGTNVHHQNQAHFLHCRLAIQDLTTTGAQPIADSENILVFNGEIYNFIELKKQLKLDHDCLFVGQGDAEVLFWGLKKEGLSFIKKTNGDFAFAFYDIKTKELVVARDRLGVKPLYYSYDSNRFFFASEIRGLKELGTPLEINRNAFNSYLALRYIRGENTIYKNIKKLRPGHYLRVSPDKAPQSTEYWNPLSLLRQQEKALDFGELLNDSVQLRLRAQVPLGTLMSGGMDSTLITKVAQNFHSPKSLTSFTYNFKKHNQLSVDAQNAQSFSLKMNIKNKICENDNNSFAKAIDIIEEPIADAIVGPLYNLIEFASQDVKVLLSGEGADEIFAGYGHHYLLNLANKLPKSLGWLTQNLFYQIVQRFPEAFQKVYPAQLSKEELLRIQKAFENSYSLEKSYHNICDVFSQKEREALLGEPHQGLEQQTASILEDCKDLSFLKKLLYLELKSWLCDYNLLKLDKISGAFGLEARVPFLDHRIIENLFCLSDNHIIGLINRKPIVKKLCKKNKLPTPSKIPFTNTTNLSVFFKSQIESHKLLESWFSMDSINHYLKNETDGFLCSKKIQSLGLLSIWLNEH